MRSDFNSNEKEIFELYLTQDCFHPSLSFKHLISKPNLLPAREEMFSRGIELIIRPECNQKCEYCYIARYGHDLYPERLTNEQILKNVDAVLTYVFDTRGLYVNHWELFAGDLFYDDLYFDIIDLFDKHLSVYLEKYPDLFKREKGVILTPTNFSFIENQERADRLEALLDSFEEKFNWELGLSISTDGKYSIDTRENRDLDDAYFDKLFEWSIRHRKNGFHPMISVSNVKNSIKNYIWWRDMFQKWYGDKPEIQKSILPYWLPARNDEWTDEAIQDYINLLDYMVDDRLRMCDNNVDKLAYHLFAGDGNFDTIPALQHLDLLSVKGDFHRNSCQEHSCSLAGLACINIANMSFVPCHRLTYPQFKGAHFILDENNKIIDYEVDNPLGYINVVAMPSNAIPRCAQCHYNLICYKGCAGAQFESSGELFLPAESVCKLQRRSIHFLLSKYDKLGVLYSAKQQKLIPSEALQVFDIILKKEACNNGTK